MHALAGDKATAGPANPLAASDFDCSVLGATAQSLGQRGIAWHIALDKAAVDFGRPTHQCTSRSSVGSNSFSSRSANTPTMARL